MWVIGVVMTACAVLVVVLRAAPSPDLPESNGEYPSVPTHRLVARFRDEEHPIHAHRDQS